jgi:dienelactone hydrolase
VSCIREWTACWNEENFVPDAARRRALAAVVLVALLLVGLAAGARPYAHGLSLVVRAANLQGISGRLANLDTVPEVEWLVSVPLHHASMRARVYAPARASRQTVLLVSGLHPAGIDEPRLVSLSRELARTNVTVVTPPLLTDRIEQAAVWVAAESGLAPRGRIGMMGISFSGGLSVVAAGRPSLRNHLLYVFSFGGHDDLLRVLRYFCAGGELGVPGDHRLTPGWSVAQRAPHDYGLAIVLLNVADQLVPADQVPGLRDGVRRFLRASYVDRLDKARAQQEFAALGQIARTLPEPSATLLEYVNRRDVASLGRRLLPYFEAYAEAAALSPSRSPNPLAPVFLLHGRDDNVIPAIESEYLAGRLRDHVPVRLLVTDLISHAEADQPPHLIDVLELGGFWSDLLAR